MRLIKSISVFIVFSAIAVGFGALISFEITYGVAGGKFGGVEMSDSPGSFWFLIEAQALMGLYCLVIAIKELWDFSQRNVNESDRKPPANIVAIYWLSAAFLVLILCFLAIWSAFDMLHNAYNLLDDFEMPKKAIFGGLFLMCMGIFGYIVYMFLFRSFMDTILANARISIQTIRSAKKN